MNNITDPKYLRTNQYKDSGNLSKRANLHRAYGTNPVAWQQWLMEKMHLHENALILDLGTGPGYFWIENRKTIPVGWNMILTDISGGMLEEARGILKGKTQFAYNINDAQEISFSEGIFNAVIANHMLYHVRDLKRALEDIHRVLIPGGKLFAATNGSEHLKELWDLENEFFNICDNKVGFWSESFNLENGNELLSNYFSKVSSHRYPNLLKVTNPQAILDYLLSKSSQKPDQNSVDNLYAYLKDEIEKKGSFNIKSDGGVFICI